MRRSDNKLKLSWHAQNSKIFFNRGKNQLLTIFSANVTCNTCLALKWCQIVATGVALAQDWYTPMIESIVKNWFTKIKIRWYAAFFKNFNVVGTFKVSLVDDIFRVFNLLNVCYLKSFTLSHGNGWQANTNLLSSKY